MSDIGKQSLYPASLFFHLFPAVQVHVIFLCYEGYDFQQDDMNVTIKREQANSAIQIARYGVIILSLVCMSSRLAQADDATDDICKTAGQGIRLHIDGTYGGYPFSVLREAVLDGVACPSSALQVQAFETIAAPPPHMRITLMRPLGQGRQGTISAMLYAQGRFVIGERMSLSSFSRTQSPSSVKADINLVTTNLWNDLAARVTHNKPIIPQ
ncbi:hypothetical protein AA0483_1227 [Acetobacter syzygii NRIC 0483]|jgi:hypothetical protein|nr:hypothetical protein AA0483_1227 [Acetobacter syzygii NRIC 0483]